MYEIFYTAVIVNIEKMIKIHCSSISFVTLVYSFSNIVSFLCRLSKQRAAIHVMEYHRSVIL